MIQPTPLPVVYPESDGAPVSESMLQRLWIDLILWGLTEWLDTDPLVVVAGDIFWYPVEGDPSVRCAPDILVAFGRPKGLRASWLQWEEADVVPQVVFEVLSPSNTPAEMARRRADYESFGVEEYYEIEPELPSSRGWVRRGSRLTPIPSMNGWSSPRLGVTFVDTPGVLRLVRADGEALIPVEDRFRQGRQDALGREAERTRAEAEQIRAVAAEREREAERIRAEAAERDRAAERARADTAEREREAERIRAEAAERDRAAERARAEAAERERERMAELLRRLGVDPTNPPPP